MMWICLSGLISAQMQKSLRQSPGLLSWIRCSVASKKRMLSSGRMSYLVSISKLCVGLKAIWPIKQRGNLHGLCPEEQMLQLKTIRKLKEHFYHKLRCVLELKKRIVVATRDMPSLFTEWLKLEGTSSNPLKSSSNSNHSLFSGIQRELCQSQIN